MSNPFDQFDSTESGAANPFDQFDAAKPTKKQNKGIAGDLVTDVKRGVEQIPGILSGLADIPIAGITGTAYANKATNALADITGFKPSQWAKDAEAEYSPGRQAAKANVDQAWEQNQSPFKDAASGDLSGIGNIAKAYIQNPQQLIGSVAESLPSMAAGGVAGRAAMGLGARGVGAAAGGVGPELPGILARTVGEKLAPVIAGSGGEGAVMAGQQMDQLSNTDADPRAAAGASLLTGIGGAAIGALGGKVAQRMGVIDPDTAMASGAMRGVTSEAGDQTIKGAIKDGAKRMAGGAASEGLFEELPQSVLEQVLSNLAQGKPWEDGVSRAAVEGTLAGGLMGGAFNAIPPTKQEAKQDTPPVDPAQQNPLLALPAPTYTGTPGGQLVQADAERQAAIDKAQAEADALYAARDEYERTQAGYRQQAKPTIITDPAPIQQRIDALMGINEARLQGFARTNYEKALENAFSEQIGVVAGKDSIEIPFTMGDYLKSKVAAADIERKTAAKAPSAAPVIPVVGPLSAVANAAVQSGAHQATVMQQAAAQVTQNTTPEGKAGTPAGAQKVATAPAQGPLTEVASAVAPNIEGNPNAANTAPVAQEAPKENAPQVGAAPAKAEGANGSTGQAFIASRTEVQLSWLAEKGKGENKDLAVAELARRQGDKEIPNGDGVTDRPNSSQTNLASTKSKEQQGADFESKGFADALQNITLPDGISVSAERNSTDGGFTGRLNVMRSGEKVGHVDFNFNHETGEVTINKSELAEAMRGKGIAKSLYSAINKTLRENGLPALGSDPKNMTQHAVNLWKSLVKSGAASARTDGRNGYQFNDNTPEAAPGQSAQQQPAKGAENAQAQAQVLTKPGAVKDAAPNQSKLNVFGLPVGVTFKGDEKVAVSALKAGDWIIPNGSPAHVLSVKDNGDGTFDVELDTAMNRSTSTFKGNQTVKRKVVSSEANQNPIKNEKPAAATVQAETKASESEPIKKDFYSVPVFDKWLSDNSEDGNPSEAGSIVISESGKTTKIISGRESTNNIPAVEKVVYRLKDGKLIYWDYNDKSQSGSAVYVDDADSRLRLNAATPDAVDAVSQPKTDAAPEAKPAPAINLGDKKIGDVLEMQNGSRYRIEGIEGDKVRTTRNPDQLNERSVLLGQNEYDKLSADDAETRKENAATAERVRAESAQAQASKPDEDTRFAKNTIFTADKVAAAKARMKAKLGTMNSGIDPELLIDGMTIAGAYIESGVRKFSDYAKAMVEDLGDGVKPYLLSFYEAARAYPGLNKMGMDSAERAASQHQALLTPEVKEAAKEVIGQAPKVEKTKPANLGESLKLKQDWGVKNIDGYTRSKTGKNQETDEGLKGGIKDEFLADSTRYLKQVEKLLAAQGFTAHTDKKGKPGKAVSANEGGPAVGGDVSLEMRNGDFGIYATVGVTNVRGMGPAHPQGVSLMVRVTPNAETDRYATKGMNNWLSLDLSAGDLSAWFDKQYQAYERRNSGVDIPAASTTLEVKNEQSAPTTAPANGEANNGTAISKQGNPVLEGLATETIQGTAGREPVGDGGSGGGSGSGQGNQATDGGRSAAGRSRGGSAAEVDTAATGGAGSGRPGLGSNGTGRPGGAVSTAASKPGTRGKGRESSVPAVAASDIPAIPEANFEITEDVALGSGGQMTKYRDNIAAIKVLKTLESERRRATAAEKKLLARYVGWGGIANAFRNGVTGQVAKDWEAEVAELESLLTPKELRAASASTRNAHYTAKEVVDFMWGAVKKMGFDGGLVLEPSVGTGNFIGLMPKEFAGKSFVTGVELDSLTARIASALYPKSSIVNTGFQKAALPSNRFRLAIGNPPFGSESLRFQFRPELNGASIHNQFFLGSMDSLEPGGIMTMVVSRYLLDAKDATSREKLAIDAKLMGAVRLPGSAFKGNALTEVVTDVLFFRKRELAEAQMLREAYFKRGKPIKSKDAKAITEHQAEQSNLESEIRWTKTGEMKDPLGGEPMVVSQYFIDRPSMVIGTMDRSGSMRQGGDIEVSLPKGEKLVDRLNALLEKMSSLPVQSMTAEALANTEKFHKAMGESLKLSATGAEADAITFDEDGDLSTVVERVGLSGESALSPMKITPSTPWSAQLQMDMDGNWFREVAKTDKAGNPVKVLDANGKPTKRNVYVREVFKKESSIPNGLLLGETKYAKMKDLISIRDLFVKQIDLEVSRATPEQMEANRAELRNAYKAFTDKHGFIGDQKNASIISDMPDEGLLMSLELSYKPAITAKKAASTGMQEAPASAKPAAILSRPVAIPPADKTSADSAVDGLAISLSETGRIDIARIAELRGLSEEAAMAELIGGDSPMAFKDPENGDELVEKNAYLSGNVRRKLEAAKLANMTANVKALEAVQPEAWSSDKVTARAGANWIPAEIYGDFLSELLGDKAMVQYSKLTNTFEVRGKIDSAAATATWGTKRESAVSLYQDILNSRSTRVVDRDFEGRAIFNQVETDAANDKRKEIVEAFNEWIFKDPDRRAKLTQQFNDTFNTRVTPQYDGSHLAFPGKVPDEIIALRRGQVNAVWRGIIDDAVLYDHAVGAGKTFTGIARAMERRRMGMSKKPMVVVPNHMVGEWAAQAYRLYPGARVLAATKKDLESKNRRRLFAKIASGDWDMVIVPHSSFQFISISPETEERLLIEELAIANAALKDAEEQAEPGSRFKPLSVKAAEALIEKIDKRLDAARGRLGKDKLLNFEQMGVDDLTIDEAHEFKNLFYSSNLTDVRGMGNKTGSDKAFDLYSKTRVIREIGGSLAFLTGTPISNSAVEAYNILRYLAPDSLKESGLDHFDSFRSQYVDATAKFEPTDSGGGLKLVTRLGRSWSNMRSLMELYYSVADVVTNDDIKRWYAEDNPGKEFPLPKVKSGDRIPVSVDATPTQLRLLQETVAAFDGLDGIQDVKERNAERLRLMDRARKLSLHAKAVDPTLDDEPGGKLDKVAEKAAEIHRKFAADKGTQLIFLDRGVPKAKGDDKIIKEYDDLTAKLRQASLADNEEEARKLVSRLDKFDANEIEELRAAQNSNWSGYQHIKDRLIEQGVPANEIAFVQDFNGDAAKEQLFQAVRDGSIRILIGSTPRMGAGTNVQERLVALHHVDATWKPSDIEQREGRIIRQGNALAFDADGNPRPGFEIEIYAYVTKRTVDAKLWDLNSTKLRMINAIRYYDGQFEMDFDDEAAVGMAEIAAIASGDPLLLERFKLSTEIDNLYRQKSSHRRRVESADDSLRSAKRLVENAPKEMAESKEDAALRAEFSKAVKEDTKAREVTMAGKRYSFEDTAQLNMDYAKIVDGIGEDEKFSLVVDGKEYTSKTAAEDAIKAAIGDIEPFVAEVDGKTFNRRSDYARAIREKIGDELAPEQEIPATAMGTIGGIPVSVEVTNKWGSASIYLGLTGKYESTGRRRSVVGQRYLAPEKHKKGDPYPLSVNALRPVISDFEKSIGYLWDGSDRIKEKADKAEKEIPAFEAQIAEKFKGQDDLDSKLERLATVEAELAGRKAEEDVQKAKPAEEGAGNIAAPSTMSPADKAIYGMAAEGKSAAEILKFIASASRNPFNRQLAKLLLKTGIAPSITVGDAKGWKFNAGEGNKYSAAYNPNTDMVALFRPAAAERNMLHELVHAATLKALEGKGMAAAQMKALYSHVKKTGKLKGMYGMSDFDEFIAEAFTNPKFQDALKKIAAPQASGTLSNAWQWFVRIVKGILGLPANQEDALSAALEIGVGVMREDKALRRVDNVPGRDVPFSSIAGTEIGRVLGRTIQDKATNWMKVNLQGKSFMNDATGWEISVGRKGISKTMSHGAKETHARSVAAIPALLKNAVLVASEQSRKIDDKMDIFAVHHFYAPLLVGGETYIARMVIKETRAGQKFYDYETSDVISPAKLAADAHLPKEGAATGNARLNMSMAELLSYVKEEHVGTDPKFVRYNVADEGWSITEPSKMDDVIYALQDKQIDMKRVMQSIMKAGKQIKDNFNPYLQEELFHGRAAKGVKDFLDFELRPLLKQMQDAKVDMGDFEEYLWNRHAEERNKQIAKINPEMQDGGSGIETAKARAYLAGLTAEQRKMFEALAGKVDAMNKASQKVLVESGLENQETIDAWNSAYRNYVPLQREDVDSGHVGTGKGFSVRGSSTKRAMGSGKKVVDIIANITMQRERNIVRAEKNRVSNALMGLAVTNPNPDFWTVDKAPKERVVEEKAIYTVMDGEGRPNEFTRMDYAQKFARSIPGASIDQTWGDRVTERVVPGFTSRDNVLLTRVNGKDHYIIFNERDERAMRMATAMKNLDMDNLGRVLSLVGKATRYLSSINTQYNPVFGVINLIRDAQGALINLSSTPLAGEQKRVLGYTKDALVGIYKDIRAHRAGKVPSSKWAALFEEFQKEGGQTGYRDQYANAEARAESIVSELAQFKEGKAKQLTRGVFGWLSDYNETMENATRLAAYKAAKEKGMSNQQAASLAKNITVNFNRKGQMATQVGALYAFFNASVQGTARIAETLFDMKDGDIRTARLSKAGKKIVYGGIMLGSMQALLLAAAGFDDDEPPEFIRERNLILPVGDGKYLTLAMPLGFHVIPGIGRIATEFVLSGGKDPLKNLAAFGSMFADSFNPIGSAGWSLQTITPSVVDPFAALAENKDFTGKEIYRKDFNALNPTPGHDRAKDVATFYSRAISEALNFITGGTEFKPGLVSWSPDAIDYLIGQATGGVGRELNKVWQTAGAASTGEELPLYKVPLVGRFVGDTEGQSGQSQKFYDAIKQINMHEAQYKGLLKDGRRDEAAEYLAENPAVRFIMAGNHAEGAVRKLRNLKRDLVDKEASPDQIRVIEERITSAMRSFNERVADQ